MFHLAWTNLRYRLLRTVVAVLSITVGIWLAMMLRGVSEGTLRKSLDEMRSLDSYMMVRAPGPIFRLSQGVMDADPQMVHTLQATEGVGAVVPFRFFLQQLTAERVGMVSALPLDAFDDAAELFPVSKGDTVRAPGQALVEEGLANNLGIKLGDSLNLTGLGSFTVQGFITSRTQLTTVQVLLDLETVAKALNDERIQGIFVKVTSPKELGRVQEAIQKAFPKVVAEPLQLVADTLGTALNRFDQFIQLIFWLSLTVAALISGLVLLSMVGEQRRDLGILKAMGASDAAVISLILGQALMLGLSGAGLGALLAWLMKATLLPQFFPSLRMELSAQWLFEAIAAGLGAGCLLYTSDAADE